MHLGQAAAQPGDGGRLLRDLPVAGGDGVAVRDSAAQVLLADVTEGVMCVRADHHGIDHRLFAFDRHPPQ